MKKYMSIWLALIVIVMFTCTGGLFQKAKPADKAFSKLKALPYDKPMLLKIPTYDGSGQAVHPDILFLNPQKSRDIPFALAMTPYPNGNDKLENPSLLFSKDGIRFYEPRKGINPIAQAPAYDHNCDADMVYNPDKKQYYIHYLESCRPDSQNVVRLVSTDMLKWKKQTAVHYEMRDKSIFALAPSVIRRSANHWYMYYVNCMVKPHRIEYIQSTDGLNWKRDERNMAQFTNNPVKFPWHVDIWQSEGTYYMLTCGTLDNPDLYLATSKDLHTWTYYNDPVVMHGDSTFGSFRIYRSTGLVKGKDLYIWFSYSYGKNKWGMGLVKKNLEGMQ